jgi:cytochrome c-type biogenesis protein CcmE
MTTTATDAAVRGTTRIKPLHLAGIAIIALALVTGYFGLQSSFRPYTVKISEATASGRSVQLAGFLGTTGSYDAKGNFVFDLKDAEGQLVTVVYPKARPANFEQAISIVAIGHYDQASKTFLAEDMLVKCPSKYQEEMTASS